MDSLTKNAFDSIVDELISLRRWLDIRSVMKQNIGYMEKKYDESGYHPTQKYCLIWDIVTFNISGIEVTMDETTWTYSLYTDTHSYIKPGASKVGQYTVVIQRGDSSLNELLVKSL